MNPNFIVAAIFAQQSQKRFPFVTPVITNQKDVNAKHWSIVTSFDGTNYSAFPAGDKPAVAPIIITTDARTGPTTGGENGLGCYLTVLGYNLGAQSGMGTITKLYIGGAEVANYRYLGASIVSFKNGLQQLTVQVGNLGGSPNGTPLAIQVKVNGTGSNTDKTFTPCVGRIWFASLSGNNTTAAAGDITKPWRSLQCWDGSAIYAGAAGGISNVIAAGDHVVVRAGAWSDTGNLTGFGNTWFRCRYPNHQGSATANIHFMAYPGPIGGNAIETVTYTAPNGTNPNNGNGYSAAFAGANSAYLGTTGDFITVSNLHFAVSAGAQSDAAPINSQYSVQGWRAINNEIGPWPSNIEALAAGISGHAFDLVQANYVHDFRSSTGLELHGIYMDSAESTAPATAPDISFNVVMNMLGGNSIQLFDNVGSRGTGWPGYVGAKIHHNWCDTAGKFGLNLSDGTRAVDVYNNTVMRCTYAPVRLALSYATGDFNINIVNNTFYDFDQVFSGSGNAGILNDAATPAVGIPSGGKVRVYSNIFLPGPHTIVGEACIYQSLASQFWDVQQNIWWGPAQAWTTGSVPLDTLAIFADPKLANVTANDFTPTAGGALNAVSVTLPISVTTDYLYTSRPQGVASDIGAIEKVGG